MEMTESMMCIPSIRTCRNGYEALQRSIRMMEAAGVTEKLKAHDPMRWVGLMNTLKAQAEEIIFQELISA